MIRAPRCRETLCPPALSLPLSPSLRDDFLFTEAFPERRLYRDLEFLELDLSNLSGLSPPASYTPGTERGTCTRAGGILSFTWTKVLLLLRIGRISQACNRTATPVSQRRAVCNDTRLSRACSLLRALRSLSSPSPVPPRVHSRTRSVRRMRARRYLITARKCSRESVRARITALCRCTRDRFVLYLRRALAARAGSGSSRRPRGTSPGFFPEYS
jgi:hypothetical protein